MSLAYLHIPDTEARLKKVMDKFCGDPVGIKAKDALLAVYDATNQLEKFQQTNDAFIKSACGDAASIKLAGDQNRSIEFKKARQLYADKQYIAAADAFYTYYKTAPADDDSLPVALYNAAVNYKLGEKPKTAISLFKEFTANTDKRFRESPYYLDALRLTALSYQGAYDYNAAVTGYLELEATVKKAKKLGIKAPEPLPGEQPRTLEQIGNEALYNAAFVSELNRDFKKAIELYTRYEKDANTPPRQKDRAAWSIANIYKSANDADSAEDAFDRWRKKYGGTAGNEDDVVLSYTESARLWKAKGRSSKADELGKAAIAAWRKKGAPKGTKGAELAGEWALVFAEREYAAFDKYFQRKTPSSDKQYTSFKNAIEDRTNKVKELYLQLDDFGTVETSMAAKVRFGDLLAGYGEKVAAIPMPSDLQKKDKKCDGCILATWEETIGQQLKKYYDEARKQWEEVRELSKRNGVSNKWSQLANEHLNQNFPDEFPVLHQELFDGTEAP